MITAKRVLIYRIGSLGDTVVALPCFHLIARAFPDAERRLLTNFPIDEKAPPAAAILGGTGLVHDYFRYAISMRSLTALTKLWWQIVRWRPQVLVYAGPARGVAAARRDARFFRMCGIRRQIGVPVAEEMQQNRVQSSDGALEPEAARLARNLSMLGDANLEDPASWDLMLTGDEEARAAGLLGNVCARPLIAVSVGTKAPAKDWGRDNWRALLARMATLYPGYALALTGAANEREASEFAADGWREAAAGHDDRGPVLNLCGDLTPRESAALFARAEIFLGHDSGPMHLAAAVQTPCVAIFSARNKPRVWFPYGRQHRVIYHRVECWGCELETCVVERKRCMTSIAVDEVVEQVRDLLDDATNLMSASVLQSQRCEGR
jgi:ADP-heptose:LPS heptosyltransferase